MLFGLTKLVNAAAALAQALCDLAATVSQVNAGLRERLALDHADPDRAALPATEQTPEPAGTGNGKRGRKAE